MCWREDGNWSVDDRGSALCEIASKLPPSPDSWNLYCIDISRMDALSTHPNGALALILCVSFSRCWWMNNGEAACRNLWWSSSFSPAARRCFLSCCCVGGLGRTRSWRICARKRRTAPSFPAQRSPAADAWSALLRQAPWSSFLRWHITGPSSASWFPWPSPTSPSTSGNRRVLSSLSFFSSRTHALLMP